MPTRFLTDPIFGDGSIQAVLDDTAVMAAMVRTEIALARAQAELDIVPKPSAQAIASELDGYEVPTQALSQGVRDAGVPVPALVQTLRTRLNARDADWLHFGATSQDIVDTAMCLCLRDAMDILGGNLAALIDSLAQHATSHERTLMLARTRGQLATPISFGLRLAQWAQPLIALEAELPEIRQTALRVQFGGASGSRNVLGDQGRALTTGLAKELGLSDSPPWHTDRSGLRRLTNWASRCIAALAKIGRDFAIAARGEVRELSTSQGGGSSTMPHKSNPVTAEALQSIAALAVAYEAGLAASAVHAEERDGVMWPLEWVLIPQLFEATGAAFGHAQRLLDAMGVNADVMRAQVNDIPAVRSEAAVFALSSKLGRVAATQIVKDALKAGQDLEEVLADHGDTDTHKAISDKSFLDPSAAMVRQIFGARGNRARQA